MHEEINGNEIENLLNNIAWLRKRHGFSKKKMAKLLGIGVGTLNQIERTELPPRLGTEVLFRIQEHFGIHPKDLLAERTDKL